MDRRALRSLLDSAQDKIVVIDEQGVYRYANAATERILGYDRETIVGTSTLAYVHEDDVGRVRSTFERLVRADAEVTETVTFRHRSAGGSWVWLESRMWSHANSEIGGYVVSSRDITSRRDAESRRRETEDQLRQIAANAGDVLWMFSADWSEVLFVNEAYETLWGMPRAKLEADPTRFIERVHPEDRACVRRMMEQLSDGQASEAEYRVDGSGPFQRWVWAKGQPIVEGGEVTKVAGFVRDVTDRKRRERQLQMLDNVLRHNLRNAMNVVFGHADLARECGGEEIEALMGSIVDTGTELLETVEKERQVVDVLVDHGDPGRVDLGELLAGALADVRERHPEATIEAETDGAPPVIAVPELQRAIRELLENAIEHACQPEIAIDVGSDASTVSVRIRDNGPPIPGNETEPLFADSGPSAVYHGTGLGLSLVYWTVDICGGTLSFCRDDTDGGNVVTVGLPRA